MKLHQPEEQHPGSMAADGWELTLVKLSHHRYKTKQRIEVST
jgi:predicted RNA binding protein YcfA (HicA-like mRNA interferase family)